MDGKEGADRPWMPRELQDTPPLLQVPRLQQAVPTARDQRPIAEQAQRVDASLVGVCHPVEALPRILQGGLVPPDAAGRAVQLEDRGARP